MKVLITGATSGIGKDMTNYMISLGHQVIAVGRDRKVLKELKKKYKDIKTVEMDLSKEENIYELYNDNKDIDILINNAGFGLFGYFNETSLDKELNMIDVNIKCVHILTKLYLSDFIKKDSGYILNVASSAGFMAGPKLSTYYATKNYVLRLSEAIYEELNRLKSNVHISVLCPGPVDTNFNKVAGGSFNAKPLTSQYVARYAINKMFKNKLIIIPGIKMKLLIFIIRFIPTKLLLRINYHIQNIKSRIDN